MSKHSRSPGTRSKRGARGRFVSKAEKLAQTKLQQQAKQEKQWKKVPKPKFRKLYSEDALGKRLPTPNSKASQSRLSWQSEVLEAQRLPAPDLTKLVEDPLQRERPFNKTVTRYQGIEAESLVDAHLRVLVLISADSDFSIRTRVVVHVLDNNGRVLDSRSTRTSDPIKVREDFNRMMQEPYVQDTINEQEVAFDVITTSQDRGLDEYTERKPKLTTRRNTRRTTGRKGTSRSKQKTRSKVQPSKRRTHKRKQPSKQRKTSSKSRKVSSRKRRLKVSTRRTKTNRRNSRH